MAWMRTGRTLACICGCVLGALVLLRLHYRALAAAANGAPRTWPSGAHHSSEGELVGSSPSPPAPRRKVSRLRFQPPPRGGGAARELEQQRAHTRPLSHFSLCAPHAPMRLPSNWHSSLGYEESATPESERPIFEDGLYVKDRLLKLNWTFWWLKSPFYFLHIPSTSSYYD